VSFDKLERKSKRMKRAGHGACAGDRIGAYRVLMGRPERNLENLGVDRRIILK
jgi:hypothetical protein